MLLLGCIHLKTNKQTSTQKDDKDEDRPETTTVPNTPTTIRPLHKQHATLLYSGTKVIQVESLCLQVHQHCFSSDCDKTTQAENCVNILCKERVCGTELRYRVFQLRAF